VNRAQRRALGKFVLEAETRRFDHKGVCLNCGAEMSGITGPAGAPPAGGSIMVCAYCSHIMEWTGEALAELSDEAIQAIAGDPEVIAVVEATARLRLKK
jgi:hypothetical protein